MKTCPRLFHDPEQAERLQALLQQGHPHVVGVLERALREADQPIEAEGILLPPDNRGVKSVAGEYTVCSAVAYLLTRKAHYAEQARQSGLYALSNWDVANLGLAARLHRLVIAWETCSEAWAPAQRDEVLDLFIRGAHGFYRQRTGNPHDVGNNWWAICHTGALISALAAHEQMKSDGGRIDLSEVIDWAAGRLTAFCCHFGDAGLYHEGTGYQGYTADSLIMGLIALKRCGGEDAFARFPQLSRMYPSLQLLACLRHNTADPGSTEFGTALSWNDAGHGWGGHVLSMTGIQVADPAQQGELRWLYDRFHGHLSHSRNFGSSFGGLFHNLIGYPYDAPAEAPHGALPLSICDSRQGLWLARNRYRDGDDCIVGAYARTTHVGGHRHDDSGSIRMMALGNDWISSPGQARPDARWQSVLCPAEKADRKPSRQAGLVIWDRRSAEGGEFGMDLRRTSVSYHERYLGVRWPTDADPFRMALLDVVDDHRPDRRWWWSWAFPAHLNCQLNADRSGFHLTAPDGTHCNVHFLAHRPDEMTIESLPESQRTFSGGHHVVYPGTPFVRAIFGGGRRLQHVFAVATVQRGDAPEVRCLDEGVALQIGATPWMRPFGAAVPMAFKRGISRSLCLEPAGFDWPPDPSEP